MKPQVYTCVGDAISNIHAPTTLLALSSTLIGVYLRFHNISMALLKLMQ